MKKIKSFSELGKLYTDISLDTFVNADLESKKSIMGEYGIDYQGEYAGKYDSKTGMVALSGVINPFNNKPLCAKLLKISNVINNGEIVWVQLSSFEKNRENNYDFTPENIFACKYIRSMNSNDANKRVRKSELSNKSERREEIRQAQNRKVIKSEEAIRRQRADEYIKHLRIIKKKKDAIKEAERNDELREKEREQRNKREKEKKSRQERQRRLEENNRRNRYIEEQKEQIDKKREELRRQQLNIRNEGLKTIIKNRKLRYLVHFTDVINLESILKNGICSVDSLRTYGINYIHNDDERWDRCTDCVNVSVELPNTWTLRKYMENYPKADWVMFFLDIELLCEQENYYSPHNASTSEISRIIRTLNRNSDFEKLFADNVVVTKKTGEQKTYNRDGIKGMSYLTTSEQAEVLVRGNISPKHIISIVFYSEQQYLKYSTDQRYMKYKMQFKPEWFTNYRNIYTFEER